ncbi:hypothetical protein EV356DRAFT_481558 [Viridothelium virens]|uniref:Mechanosensitive ion channel protein n=1 Tax=Viridothelium virens TaxID=1048519 RepID=A0A6A6HF75_VIRVR|nr:hypothetical protein EV356DRAFT_481558 [Viridothelium virens]
MSGVAQSAKNPKRNSTRHSRQGYLGLGSQGTNNMQRGNPNDATIDIPLHPVTTNGSSNNLVKSPTAEKNNYNEKKSEKKSRFGGRRHKKEHNAKPTGHVGYDGEEDTITTMGKIYKKIADFSIVTRYFLYVLPLGLIIAIPIIIGATAAKGAKIAEVRIVWFFSWVEIVWLSLWVAKIVAHWLPAVFKFGAGVVSSGTRKYALVLSALEFPLALVGWAVTSLATFAPIMQRNPDQRKPGAKAPGHWVTIVTQILAAIVVATIVFLVEKLIIQLISINYHRKQFNAKIKDNKHQVFLLGLLYDASRALFPAYCPEFAEEDYVINDSIEINLGLSSKKGSHQRSGSTTPMRLVQDVGRFGDKVTAAFGHYAQEITGKKVFDPTSAHSIVVEALEKTRSSEALARRLWMSFVVEGKDALYPDDLLEVLGRDREQEAEDAFFAIDRDGNGDISLDEMILTVTAIGRERKSIANSMHDVDQAINVLDRMLMVVVAAVAVLVMVAFLNTSFVTTLATTGTALLSLSFVFSATAQEILGSCIFLFVKHPYDIGDRVDVSKEQLTVEHISLLFTVFKRVETGRLVQIPHIVLNTLWVENVSRSGTMRERLPVYVDFGTSFEDVQLLKAELQNFVRDKENSRDFQPDIDIEVVDINEMDKLQLQVEIRHKSNWANETIRAARRSKFMCALVLALRKVPINSPSGGDATLGTKDKPSYSVAVSTMEAEETRQAFLDKQDAARLVPKNKPKNQAASTTGIDYMGGSVRGKVGSGSLRSREGRAIDGINERDPSRDITRDELWAEEDNTLDERNSAERHQDFEEVRGLLRKASSSGKRRPSHEPPSRPGVPTITEPNASYQQTPVAATDYAAQQQQQQQAAAMDQYGRSGFAQQQSPGYTMQAGQPYPHPLMASPISPGSTASNNPYQTAPARTMNPYGIQQPSRGPPPPGSPMSPSEEERLTAQYRPYDGA